MCVGIHQQGVAECPPAASQLVNADRLVFQKLIEEGVLPVWVADGAYSLVVATRCKDMRSASHCVLCATTPRHGSKPGRKANGGKGGKKAGEPFFTQPKARAARQRVSPYAITWVRSGGGRSGARQRFALVCNRSRSFLGAGNLFGLAPLGTLWASLRCDS